MNTAPSVHAPPFAAVTPLLAAAVVVPLLGSVTDPFGGDALRPIAMQAALLLASVWSLVAGRRSALSVFPALLLLIAALGLRDLGTAAVAIPLALAGGIALAAPGLAAYPRALPLAIAGGGIAVAGWGLADAASGGAGVVVLGNANRVGEFVATVIPAAAVLFFAARGANAIAGLVALGGMFAWALVTASRGGLVIGALEIVALGLICRAPRRLLGLFVVAAALIAVLYIPTSTRHRVDFAVSRIRAGLSPEYPSNVVRLGVIRASTRTLRDHPLGVGHGRFEDRFMTYRDPVEHRLSGWRSRVPDAHNQYLHAGVETGWLGALAVIALLWVPVFGAFHASRRTDAPASVALARVAAVTAAGLGIYSLFGTPLLNLPALTNVALLLGAAAGVSGIQPRRSGARLAIAAIALAPALGTVPAWLGQSDRERARELVEQKDKRAVGAWQDAATHTPYSSQTWLRVAVFNVPSRDYVAIDRALERAADLAPHDVAVASFTAQVALSRGDAKAALAAATRACELQPWNPLPHLICARALRTLNREEDAITADRAAVDADIAARTGPSPDEPLDGVRAAGERVAKALGREAVAVRGERGLAAALPLFEQVYAYDPNHANANLALAKHYDRQKDEAAARRHRYRGLLTQGLETARIAHRLRRDDVYGKAIRNLTLASLQRPDAIEPYVYLAAIRTLRGSNDAPWHDAIRARADLVAARRLGLQSLDQIAAVALFRNAVEPVWRTLLTEEPSKE